MGLDGDSRFAASTASQRNARHEKKANQRAVVLPSDQREASQVLVEQARLQDQEEFQKASEAYSEQMAEWEKLKNLARRILAGEHKAFTETLVGLNPFAEISDLGSAIHFTVRTAKLVECGVKVNGKQAIPKEHKTLTSSGKVSIKPMPKGRFHEIYQDYVCGCVLRVAREVFALFPVDTVLTTAVVDSPDPRTGRMVELPVLSVAIPRAVIARLDFGQLDPSDAMENFRHRGDFKASRKSEAFQPITPLAAADIAPESADDMDLSDLLAKIQALREEIKNKIAELSQTASSTILLPSSAMWHCVTSKHLRKPCRHFGM